MPNQQSFARITYLEKSVNNTWLFRVDLESEHAPFIENFMLDLAKSEVFRGGWVAGVWWWEDDAMNVLQYLFSNWKQMKADALAIDAFPSPNLIN